MGGISFNYRQKDGSIFLGKCRTWNPFVSEHDPIHLYDITYKKGGHLVRCKRCGDHGVSFKSPDKEKVTK